ncbi:Hypothetical protein, putative [Bodo saltans]|uniref:Uncharacterized protein n=1 Tax=Bodo saltans TaxID=75058 RepID=A0A0S4JCD8_BODSA|nr:Hypothetical protein, putative [Bodo saltans]|eukprot:CUG87666.1 Hypothetical protein, putative [Bodo saltans]
MLSKRNRCITMLDDGSTPASLSAINCDDNGIRMTDATVDGFIVGSPSPPLPAYDGGMKMMMSWALCDDNLFWDADGNAITGLSPPPPQQHQDADVSTEQHKVGKGTTLSRDNNESNRSGLYFCDNFSVDVSSDLICRRLPAATGAMGGIDLINKVL